MCFTSDAVSGDLLQQALVTDFVEGLTEVHHQDISLMTTVAVAHKVMVKLCQLGLTRKHAPEAMLVGVKDVMLLCVSHDVVYHDMLEELTANTREADWPVIYCMRLLALFVGCDNVSITPVIRHPSQPV